jgi:hypothetical protein
MRAAPLALVCLLVGACFEPAPHEGFACGLADWCPEPLFCAADHTCRRANPPGDGGGDGGVPQGPPNHAFVTSQMFLAGSLMTVTGADNECMKAAAAAGLPGRYVAWLAVSGQRASDRLGPASGWRRTDGKPFAHDASALMLGNILYPLRKTETGAELSDSGYVLTGTDNQGRSSGEDCAGLTSSSKSDLIFIGESTGGTDLWTAASDTSCDQPGHLYCLQIDYQQPVVPVRTPGPVAFLSMPYMAGGGLAGADAHCMQEAASANLSGNFKALLSTTAKAALDRFQPLPTTPWVRVDGVATTRDFMTWDAPINVTASGLYMNQKVFSGAASPTQTSSTQSESCIDWTDISGTVALIGNAASASASAFGSASSGRCNGESFYCLQVP